LNRYLQSVKQYSWILLACMLLAAIGGYLITKSQPVAFQAPSTLFVNAGAPDTTYPGGPTSTDSLGEATNYAAYISSRSFMAYVLGYDANLQKLGYTADYLVANTLATPSPTYPTISIVAVGRTPSGAILVANDIANGFQAYVAAQNQQALAAKRKDLQTQLTTYQNQEKSFETQILQIPSTDPRYPIITSNRDSTVRLIETLQGTLLTFPSNVAGDVTVIQLAATKDVTPTVKSTTTIAITAGVGLLVGILVMLLVIYLDERPRAGEDVKDKLGLAYLGGISEQGWIRKNPLQPTGSGAYELADIAANLKLTGILPGQWHAPRGAVVLITSPKKAAGKTTVTAALAAMLAQASYQVVIVDGNLRQPATHLSLGTNNSGIGLSSLLTSRGDINEAVQRTRVPDVWFFPAGQAVANPALLFERRLPAILTKLRARVDCVIIDGPAVLSGAEASVLASMVDGTVLVVDSKHDKLPLLLRVKEVLCSLTHTPTGVIMNRLSRSAHNNYYASGLPKSPDPYREIHGQPYHGGTASNGKESLSAAGNANKSLYAYLEPGSYPPPNR
jgi:capsular exopolysaccharide synthesis family protein